MSHYIHRDERNTLSDERRQEAQWIAGAANERAERRERYLAGYVPYTPENNAVRDRKRAANHNCDVIASWINRILGYQRNANTDKQYGVAAALQLAILALREQEVLAKVEEREAEEAFKKMIGEAV